MHAVLVVENDPNQFDQLQRQLAEIPCRVEHATSLQAALALPLNDFSLIISELELPDAPGTDLALEAGDTPLLLLSSYASLPGAMESLHNSAVDYLTKPFADEEANVAIRRLLRGRENPEAAPTRFPGEPGLKPPSGMIGQSLAMQQVYKRIHKSAPTQSTVLIRGETGTGKELVARALHDASHRSDKKFIAVNCAAIPETLIESELFGHEKGAFTGAATRRSGLIEAAEGGTLFLDEIGELPPEAQARLLRFIQESEIRRIGSNESHQVDVRLIAATHRDLKQRCADGGFREDLYYRINVVRIDLPPLHQRGADVLEIAQHLLDNAAERHAKPGLQFLPDALQAITSYNWPGNVRELENVVERAAIMCDTQTIDSRALEIDVDLVSIEQIHNDTITPFASSGDSNPRTQIEPNEDLTLEDYFQRFVLENQDHMNETELAKKLGISRKCLWERRQRFGIPRAKSGGQSSLSQKKNN